MTAAVFGSIAVFVCIIATVQGYTNSFDKTPTLAKSIVGGLTSLSNVVFKPKDLPVRVLAKKSLTPGELVSGIKGDFERGYLFTGSIDNQLYDEDCVFTDPTLTFQGLAVFERNIEAIKPLLKAFLGRNQVTLYSVKLEKPKKKITTSWRMYGEIKLPWKPVIDLRGQTEFTFADAKNGGRIVDYFEKWELTAVEALLQLITPSTYMEDSE
jgi:hypothetical protein